MCELKRRLVAPNGKIELDTQACTLKCGDDKVLNLLGPVSSV